MFDAFINSESNIFLLIGAFVVGLVLIIYGGDKFVDSAIWIAVKTKMPQMLIGATLVSIGTTLPELFASYTAAAQGSTSIAVGNAVGSIMCNTALILAISLTASPAVISRKEFLPKFLMLTGTVVLLFLFALFAAVTVWQCVVLLAIFVFYIVYNVVTAVRKDKDLQKNIAELPEDERKDDPYAEYKNKKTWLMILFFVFGAAGIAVGANLLVSSVQGFCLKIGVSEAVISLTVIAFGTSLPELVTALVSLKKNSTEISMGNIIGANILNATLIVGGSGLICGGHVVAEKDFLTTLVTVGLIFIVLAVLGLPILLKKRTYRFQGVVLLSVYGVYLAFLIYQLIVTKV